MTTLVQTTAGAVRGSQVKGALVFKGVPFAAPPIGPARFGPPQPRAPWRGELDGTTYGPISLQHIDPLSVMLPGAEWNFYHPGARQDEDCLNLNIWTPGTEGARPVMVWFHGGAFLAGSGTGLWYDGDKLAREHGVVVVTVNYRLGALGFLTAPDPNSETGYVSNAAILDQVAALRWVEANIAAFGGDPAKVCIFGESAGAMSVSTLLVTPSASGLFSRAIVQSGHAGTSRSMEASLAISERFATKLGVSLDAGGLERLRQASTSELMKAQALLTAETPVPFFFTVDGHYLPEYALEAVNAGQVSEVPLLIGTNSDENKLFRAMSWGPGDGHGSFPDRVKALFSGAEGETQDLVDQVLSVYQGLARDDDDLWDILTTDRMWRLPVQDMVDAYNRHKWAVFNYEFGWPTPVLDGQLQSSHALEIPFAFDNLGQMGVTDLVGDDIGEGSRAQEIASAMSAAWTAFAEKGDPSTSQTPWPRAGGGAPEQLFFGPSATELRPDPHQERLAWWRKHQHLAAPPF